MGPRWQRGPPRERNPRAPLVLEGLDEAQPVERGEGRDHTEALLRKLTAPLAAQHGLEPVHEGKQQRHVGDRVADLLGAQLRARPVRVAGRLVELDVEELEQVVLEAVAVAVGPHQLARGARAIERRDLDAEPVPQRRHVEAGKVEDLEDLGLLEQALEPRRASVGRQSGFGRLARGLAARAGARGSPSAARSTSWSVRSRSRTAGFALASSAVTPSRCTRIASRAARTAASEVAVASARTASKKPEESFCASAKLAAATASSRARS